MQFDIEEFYPSISKDLLLEAIDYTKGFVNISEDETIPLCTLENLFFPVVLMCGQKKMMTKTLTSL